MRESTTRVTVVSTIATLACLACLARALGAQQPATPATSAEGIPDVLPHARATLQPMADDWWLRHLDRDGGVGGRWSRLGVLRRFPTGMSVRYGLDVASTAFRMDEDAAFVAAPTAFRASAGSYVTTEMFTVATWKGEVPVSARWRLQARLDRDDGLEARRNLLRLRSERRLGAVGGVYVEGSFTTRKSDMDATAGLRLGGASWRAAADVTVHDYLNDYLNRDSLALRWAEEPLRVGTRRTAVTGRWRGEARVGPLRLETHAVTSTPGWATVDSVGATATRASGFTQRDRVGWLLTLAEVTVSPRATVGLTASRVVTRTERAPLAAGDPRDDRRQQEGGRSLGAFVLLFPSRTWRLQGLAVAQRRSERVTDAAGAASRDFEEPAVTFRLDAARAPYRGAVWALTAVHDARQVRRRVPEPGPYRDDDELRRSRLVLETGYAFGAWGEWRAGVRADYDWTRDRRFFPGYQGRVVLRW